LSPSIVASTLTSNGAEEEEEEEEELEEEELPLSSTEVAWPGWKTKPSPESLVWAEEEEVFLASVFLQPAIKKERAKANGTRLLIFFFILYSLIIPLGTS